MPDGAPRGLPKRQDRSILLPLPGVTASFDSATNDISVPTSLRPGDVALYLLGFDANQQGYLPAASQDSTCVTVSIAKSMQTTNATEAVIALSRLIEGQTAWPTTFNHNQNATTFDAQMVIPFRPSRGFRGLCTRQHRDNRASTSSFTYTPPTNPGPYPGGIFILNANIDTGGAGPNTPASTNGWVGLGGAGTFVAAYWLIPPDKIATPPSISISCSRSDTWAVVGAYVV